MNYDVSSRLRLINTRMQRNSQFIVVFLAILALTYSTGSGSETQKLPPEKWDRKLKSIVQPTSTTTTTIAPSANNAVAKRPETEVDDTEDPCAKIKAAFANITEPDDTPPCRCLPESLGILHQRSASHYASPSSSREFGNASAVEGVWIGCTRQSMPSVFRALNALPSPTVVAHMWIWNSLINILPNDMFANVWPASLTIESSGLSVFRKGAFTSIGKHLKSLSLKNNILRVIERKTFSDLTELRTLDLSGNKLSDLRRGQFDDLRRLETFHLSSNQIGFIEDGTFESLANVRTLDLSGNRLTNITKDTFRGLVNLEVLYLNDNNISAIDRDAFTLMKKLRLLELGSNRISTLELRGLTSLQRLYLNNNTIGALADVVMQDLPALQLLNADRNRIEQLADNDFLLLGATSSRLASLSLAENNISRIGCRALDNVPQLVVLALQGNRITSLTCTADRRESILVQSAVRNLQRLRRLYLSRNQIEALHDGDVNMLTTLKELALDQNHIREISRNALKGLNLTKLFLNNNNLYYLPEGIFDGWNVKEIRAVDLAGNQWECICRREWIGKWLSVLGPANTPSGDLSCLMRPCQDNDGDADDAEADDDAEEFEGHRAWITAIACLLAVVALALLVASGVVYMQANCYPPLTATLNGASNAAVAALSRHRHVGVSLRNLPPDMMRLIPSQESLVSFPNPLLDGQSLLKPHNSVSQPPISSICINVPPSATVVKPRSAVVEENGAAELEDASSASSPSKEKKRVRFDGI